MDYDGLLEDEMKSICFVPYEEGFPKLHRLNCPCCKGGKKMPTEEELEQMVIKMIDEEEDELLQLRASVEHHGLGIKRLTQIYNTMKESRKNEK